MSLVFFSPLLCPFLVFLSLFILSKVPVASQQLLQITGTASTSEISEEKQEENEEPEEESDEEVDFDIELVNKKKN